MRGGNDDNGCFPTFYEFVKYRSIFRDQKQIDVWCGSHEEMQIQDLLLNRPISALNVLLKKKNLDVDERRLSMIFCF